LVTTSNRGEENQTSAARTPRGRAIVYSVTLSDTTPRAAAIQLQLYRQASPSRRAQIAVELSNAARSTTIAGIRRRHPEYSQQETALAFLRLVYGVGK